MNRNFSGSSLRELCLSGSKKLAQFFLVECLFLHQPPDNAVQILSPPLQNRPHTLVQLINARKPRSNDYSGTAAIRARWLQQADKPSSPNFDFAQASGAKLGDELAECDLPRLDRREPVPERQQIGRCKREEQEIRNRTPAPSTGAFKLRPNDLRFGIRLTSMAASKNGRQAYAGARNCF